MKKKTKQWGDEVQKKSNEHGLGPPHLQAWEGLLEGLLAPGLEIGAANRVDLLKLKEINNKMDEGEKSLVVRHCRAKTTYNKEIGKLVFSIRG
eukprot:16387454-Heterocapsa_arctica.AAC.1